MRSSSLPACTIRHASLQPQPTELPCACGPTVCFDACLCTTAFSLRDLAQCQRHALRRGRPCSRSHAQGVHPARSLREAGGGPALCKWCAAGAAAVNFWTTQQLEELAHKVALCSHGRHRLQGWSSQSGPSLPTPWRQRRRVGSGGPCLGQPALGPGSTGRSPPPAMAAPQIAPAQHAVTPVHGP